MNFLMKIIYKRMLKKSLKYADTYYDSQEHKDFVFEFDSNPEVRSNCAEEIKNIAESVLSGMLLQFKQGKCKKADITINKDYSCTISNDGEGLDYTILKNASFTVFDRMLNNEISDNFFETMKDREEDEFFDISTVEGNFLKGLLYSSSFEIVSNFNGKKYIKSYQSLQSFPVFKKKGKTTDSGLSVKFNSNLNLFSNLNFGFKELSELSQKIMTENPGFIITVTDLRTA